jgi:arginine-tRNA-protein transferase
MFTEKHFPESLSGEELDAYLDKAWYRMGQTIFTCHFLFFEDNLYSPIWLRLPLEGYVFRKSLRRILNKNEDRFRTLVRPATLSDEKELLFQYYRKNFKGSLAPTLKSSLLDNYDHSVYHTYEVAVYDGDNLVAYSFFDLGNDSLASIKGVYDPDYGAFSLGLFTMLKEIQFGLEQGYKFFYPGYAVPGYPRFDYKLRMGRSNEVDYYNLKKGCWEKFCIFEEDQTPVKVLTGKLTQLSHVLARYGITTQMLFYPAYEANAFGYENERFLESPLFLACFSNVFPRPRFIIFYDLWKEKFVFCHCMPVEDLSFYFEYSMLFDNGESKHFLDFILKKSVIVESEDVRVIAAWVSRLGTLIKPQQRQRGFWK